MLSVSAILILTKLVSTLIDAVRLAVISTNDTTVGAAFSVTLMLILPDPILSNWSLNVTVEVIVSPEPVPEPLIFSPNDKLPSLSIAIWELDEVKDWTTGVPKLVLYETPISACVPVLPFEFSTILSPLTADSII